MRINLATAWKDVPRFDPGAQGDDPVPVHSVLEKLDRCRVSSLDDPPDRPPIILSYNGKALGEAGNIVVVQGQAKAGKSALVSAIIGASLGGGGDQGGDCLKLVSPNPNRKAVIHFDTEQSRYHHFAGILRTVTKRALQESVPPNLRSYSILRLDMKHRRAAIKAEMERAAVEHNGIHLVVIDGVADISADTNDPKENIALVDELHQLADQYECVIVAVLHENPGSENNKTRGHLGSQLERKAQTSIVVHKGADEIVAVYARMARSCSWPKKDAAYFKYDVAVEMHVTAEDPTAERQAKGDAAKKVELQELAKKVLAGPMKNADLLKAIMAEQNVGDSTAKTRIKSMLSLDLVMKNDDGEYYLNE